MKYLLIILSLTSLSFSQTAELFRNVTTYSARSGALGGTNIASNPGDYSGLSNPAMLSLLKENSVSISSIFNNYFEDRKYPAYSAFDSRNGNEVYAISELFDDQYNFGLSYIMDLQGKRVVVSLARAFMYDHNYYYSEIVRKNQANDRKIAGAQEIKAEGQVYVTSLSASLELTDLTLGFGLNLINASDINYVKQVLLEESTSSNDYNIGTINENTGDFDLKSDNSPLFVRIGALFKLSDQIRLGTTYANGVDLEFKSEGSKLAYTLPGEFGVGVNYFGSNKLAATFMFDYRLVSWSTYKIDHVDQNLDDVHTFSFGLEHKLGENSYPIRLGARFENNKHDKNIANTTFTFGSGVRVQDFQINFSFDYGYRSYSEKDLFPESIWIDASNGNQYTARTEFDTVDQTFMNFKFDVSYAFKITN